MYCKTCGAIMNDSQAVCLKCGVKAGVGKAFCPNCGNQIEQEEAVICVNCGASLEKPGANGGGSLVGITKRSIGIAILLSIVTCGIYGIYWFICLTNDMNKASGNHNDTRGGIAFLLGLVTCGIYLFYWAYKMGVKRDQLTGETGSSGILYLVLSLFGLSIVVYCLAQDAINKAVGESK